MNDLVQYEERLQADGKDEGAKQQKDYFRKQFGRFDRIMFAP